MSVNALTARSSRQRRPQKRTATIKQFPKMGKFRRQEAERRKKHNLAKTRRRQLKTRKFGRKSRPKVQSKMKIEIVSEAQQKRAMRIGLLKMLAKLIGKKAGGPLADVAREIGAIVYKRTIMPQGFPGWGNFPEGWTSNAGAPYPAIQPGQYTANGFDNGPWSTVVHNIIDTSDGSPITGFRYWGHFHASNPLPNGRPGDDWATQPQFMPDVFPDPKPNNQPQTTAQARTRYRIHRDKSVPRIPTRWTPRNNVEVSIARGGKGEVKIRKDVARVRDKGDKAKPKNIFVYLVLKRFANAGGETKEWIDIFAEASGYIKGSMMLPERLRDTGLETQAKAYWLFNIQGIENMDWDLLAELVRYNTIEDIAFGFAGQLSKAASRSLGLTVGFQTGVAI